MSGSVAALALALLIGSTMGRAAATPTEDAYIAGYATAVLERDFRLSSATLTVHDGVVTVDRSDLAGLDRARVVEVLSRIRGVRRVEIAGAAAPEPPKSPSAPADPVTAASNGAATAAAQRRRVETLPSRRLFDPLLADPRWPHFGASFVHINNSPQLESGAQVSFGEIFPLVEADAPFGGRIQLGILGAAFALFDTGSESENLINTDYFVGVPIDWRNGPWSAQLRYFHQSSHLGDEFLLRGSGVTRVNLSFEQADLRVSYDIGNELRVYGGGGAILRSEPKVEHLVAQLGGEYTSRDTFFWQLLRPVAALDLQAREFQQWQPDLSLRAGLQIDSPFSVGRKVQFVLEYYNGKAPWGQFLNQNVEYYGVGTHFYF